MEEDKIYDDIRILKVLIAIEEDYGHLTLRNIIDRFKARVKYAVEHKQQEKQNN